MNIRNFLGGDLNENIAKSFVKNLPEETFANASEYIAIEAKNYISDELSKYNRRDICAIMMPRENDQFEIGIVKFEVKQGSLVITEELDSFFLDEKIKSIDLEKVLDKIVHGNIG